MDNDQQFCLKWNNYHANLQTVFAKLFDQESLVDVTLACEGKKLKCHKLVLSACSSYFEDLILDNPCQHPIVVMKDVRFWELEALVKFMYHGEVNVSQDKLGGLLKVAEALKIKGLAETGSDESDRSMTQGVPNNQTEDRLVRKLDDENVGLSRKRQKSYPSHDRHSVNLTSDLPSVAADSKAAEEDLSQKPIIDSSDKSEDVKNSITPVIKYESEEIIADDDSQTMPVFGQQFEGDSGDDFAMDQSSASTSTPIHSGQQGETRRSHHRSPRRNYSEDTLRQCLHFVENGLLSQLKASHMFGVPQPTISSIIRRKKLSQRAPQLEKNSSRNWGTVWAPDLNELETRHAGRRPCPNSSSSSSPAHAELQSDDESIRDIACQNMKLSS